MRKVVLTREQSDALSYVIKEYGKERTILIHAKDGDWTDICESLNHLPLLDFVNAVINGWNIKNTSIDDLVYQYTKYMNDGVSFYHKSWCNGVIDALNATGQVIKGINEH